MDDLATSDEILAGRAIKGDRAAFSLLLERHYDFVFRTAWKWCGNREDAEDVAQDVCIRLARALDQWSGKGALTTWLYRIVVNAVHDLRRKQSNIRRLHDDFASDLSLVTGHQCDEDESLDDLWQQVRKLPERQRDCVLLVHSEGLTHQQAAEALGISGGTVASNLHDAKKRLQKMLQPRDSNEIERRAEQ